MLKRDKYHAKWKANVANVANTMQNVKWPCQNVANSIGWFYFQTVANDVHCNSKGRGQLPISIFLPFWSGLLGCFCTWDAFHITIRSTILSKCVRVWASVSITLGSHGRSRAVMGGHAQSWSLSLVKFALTLEKFCCNLAPVALNCTNLHSDKPCWLVLYLFNVWCWW